MNFSDVLNLAIPEGDVIRITDSVGTILWQKSGSYTFLTYIQGTGTQYIDTGLLHTSLQEEYYLDMMIDSQIQQNILLSNGNDVAINLYAQTSSRGTLYVKYGQTSYSQRTNINPGSYMSRAVWRLYNRYLYRGNSLLMNPTQSSSIPAQTNTLKLLTSDGTNCVHGKIYGFQVIDRSSGDTIMDLVPAMRDSDNEVGLYDNVSGEFFTNAGTGSFNYG